MRAVLLFVVRWTWRLGWRFGLGLAVILAAFTAWYYQSLPPASALLDGRDRGSVILLDANDEVFAWRGDQYGGAVRASDISPHLVHAVVATEDRRFWSHWGVDPIGLARAMIANLRAGALVQGGSTLTQQTAKNVFLTHERSLERKLKELPMALAMELKYSKDEILSIYLNRVYLGAGAWGFEAAAQRYFGKSARAVTPAEAAMLAGLLKAPSRYAPTTDLAAAQGRADIILGLMADQGYLERDQLARARANPARLSKAAQARAGGAFADWVMESGPEWLTRETTEDVTIATTFDPVAQRAAEDAVAHVFDTRVREGSDAQAAVVILSHDGAVRAMVGGRDPAAAGGQFNRAAQALRQPGSAFKPVVYAAALAAGRDPSEVVEDRPIDLDGWRPANYAGKQHGLLTLTEALAQSVNTVAVRLALDTGLDRVRGAARALGLDSDLPPVPAIALGASETTLLDLSGVYASIASAGRRAEPFGIRRVALRDDPTPLMTHAGGADDQAIPPQVARRLTAMLREVVRSGTGTRAALADRPAAGKTGTTQEARDAWFVGFTADYVAGVWMGYDDNTPLTGVTGGGLPAEIWRETMTRLHRGLAPRPLDSAPLGPPEGERVAGAEPGAAAESVGEGLRAVGGAVGRVVSGVVGLFTGGGNDMTGPARTGPERPGPRREPEP
ncbi:MAG: transglycosylase domain-containing protein [Pseudomonadota bacterium]